MVIFNLIQGWDDIKNLAMQLKENNQTLRDTSKYLILPLHVRSQATILFCL